MPEIIEVEFHSKALTDFQLRRLDQASVRKYSVPVTAFISDAFIANDMCHGVSFGHVEQGDAFRPADGGLLQTGKIQRVWKEGRFWLLETQSGNYVLGSFIRGVGRKSFRELLQTGERC
ncbi:hypothetical protein [Pseudomonas sp. O230]|uniref:hypothetical protein n=1 Tax=Pseudomonas sp. O230 TaxID=3159450 RepID=UPI00387B38B1